MTKLSLIAMALIVASNITFTVNAQPKDTYLSEEIQGYCVEIGEEYGICPELLMAMIEKESAGDPNAMNGNCVGLMQINTDYHWDRLRKITDDELATIAGFFSPKINIQLGADYIMELAGEYGDIGLVLMKYNGFSKAEEYYEQGKLSNYAEKILERSEELERVHGK